MLEQAYGAWPLKEYLDGTIAHTKVPARRLPVERSLAIQGRVRHLFEPVRQEELLEEIQGRVDAYWDAVTPP